MSGLCLLEKQYICSHLKQQKQQASLTINHLQNYSGICCEENSSEQHESTLISSARGFLCDTLISMSLWHRNVVPIQLNPPVI